MDLGLRFWGFICIYVHSKADLVENATKEKRRKY